MRQGFSIIDPERFVQATRDSGYKGTASAISELIDNALQAGAKSINISISERPGGEHPIELSVEDDGAGMDAFTLRQALRFGGSSRFNDRSGLGRYGMGLPNSALSQAKRLTVTTWREQSAFSCYLDVDEIASGAMRHVPTPKPIAEHPLTPSGTCVTWSSCDRLDHKRAQTLAKRLSQSLGRRFRYFIWGGLKLTINGEAVSAVDPLFLQRDGAKAMLFGAPIEYKFSLAPGAPQGLVKVIFSELPILDWLELSNEEKRVMGISKGAGVSIIRAGREVDYGWFFMGSKRRENYDDWWRCEVHFEPVLDEAFGITHTKQQIRPNEALLEALTPDIEAQARALNARARKAHAQAKSAERFSAAILIAERSERFLAPLSEEIEAKTSALMETLRASVPHLESGDDAPRYSIVTANVPNIAFFSYAISSGQFVLALNPAHPFFKIMYQPLLDSDAPQDVQRRVQLELLLLSAARSEASTDDSAVARHRLEWSNILATYLTP